MLWLVLERRLRLPVGRCHGYYFLTTDISKEVPVSSLSSGPTSFCHSAPPSSACLLLCSDLPHLSHKMLGIVSLLAGVQSRKEGKANGGKDFFIYVAKSFPERFPAHIPLYFFDQK